MAKIILKTKSYTSIASGEGAGIIDSEIVYDNNGFPFIPAKRLKGLLKESAIEILEILNSPKNELIETLFGKESIQGELHIPNLYVENYFDIKKELDCISRKIQKHY